MSPEDAVEWVEVRSTARARRAASRPRPRLVAQMAVPGIQPGEPAVVTWAPRAGVLYSIELEAAAIEEGEAEDDGLGLTWEERLR